MYRSTFSHLNTSFELPTSEIHPVQTSANADSRPGRSRSPRRRRRLAFGFARPAPRGGC